MNSEFHYYSTYFLALQAGWSRRDAQILAYSAQYVDNNLRGYVVEDGAGRFETHPTQDFGFWDPSNSWRIFLPFHFPPTGDPGASVRADGGVHPWEVRPNGELARQLLLGALRRRDLCAIGIALHTFADTWAHQNWIGAVHPFNQADPDSALPPLGHAQALRQPDLYEQVWTDRRLIEPVVENRGRFTEAARKIYRYLCLYAGKDYFDEDWVLARWQDGMDLCCAGDDARQRASHLALTWDLEPYSAHDWVREALEPGDEPFWEDLPVPGSDKVAWLAQELLVKTRLMPAQVRRLRPGAREGLWLNWHRAAEEQRAFAQTWMAERGWGPSGVTGRA